MANSGSAQTSTYLNKYIKFSWSVSSINREEKKATISWNLKTIASNNIYHLLYGSNYFKINGNTVYSKSQSYRDGNKTVYNGYVANNSWCGDKTVYDTNGNYTGVERWVHGLTNLGSGTFNVYYDDSGNASFNIEGNFCWYSSAVNNKIPYQTFNLDKQSFNSKIWKKDSSGWSIDKNIYVWKTTDKGTTWNKVYLWKTTDKGTTWNKMNT